MASPSRARLHAAWRERIGPVWKSRLAAGGGAVGVGLFAWAFAAAADSAQSLFSRLAQTWPYAPLIVTPTVFVLLAWATRRYVPAAKNRASLRSSPPLVWSRTAARAVWWR